MNLNILLVPCLLLLTEVESLLESIPLEHISEMDPETKETRTLYCCSAAMSTLTTNITHELDTISNTLTNEVERINEQIRIRDSRLDQVERSLNDIDRRRRDKFQLRDHTLDLVENSLNDMDQRRRVLIEAESMLESSSLKDIIELKPETKQTQDLECCLAAEIDVKNILVHAALVVSVAIQDAVTQINEEFRLQDFRIGELQKKRNFLDGRMRGK